MAVSVDLLGRTVYSIENRIFMDSQFGYYAKLVTNGYHRG